MALETDQAIKDCFLNLTLIEKQEMKKRMDEQAKKKAEKEQEAERKVLI